MRVGKDGLHVASDLVLNTRLKLGLYWCLRVRECVCVQRVLTVEHWACVVDNRLSNRIFFIRQAGDAQED